MRYKIYTKEQIIRAGYNIIAREGFDKFTARNVARELGISTQPIYLQFKNMDDLKHHVLDKVWADLVKNSLTKPFTGDVLIDAPTHFVEWALKKPILYKACWVDPNGGGKYLFGLSEEFYHEYAFKDERFKHLSEQEFKMHHLETLILISGLISLQMSGIITLSHDEIIKMITKILGDIAQGQKLELNF